MQNNVSKCYRLGGAIALDTSGRFIMLIRIQYPNFRCEPENGGKSENYGLNLGTLLLIYATTINNHSYWRYI